MHFQIQTTVTRAWHKRGSAPTVKSFPGRLKVAYAGFVIPGTGELYASKPERFNYETTIEAIRAFLKAKPVPEGKHYVFFLDNASWHTKAFRLIQKERMEEYKDIREEAVLEMLPPCSPDLNPIEQVWRIVRREVTHNRYFATLDDLTKRLDDYFTLYAKPNQKFSSLCSFNFYKRESQNSESQNNSIA